METNSKKSWPVNLLQVLNLTFDPCFKIKLGHHTKMAIYQLHIGLWVWNSHE